MSTFHFNKSNSNYPIFHKSKKNVSIQILLSISSGPPCYDFSTNFICLKQYICQLPSCISSWTWTRIKTSTLKALDFGGEPVFLPIIRLMSRLQWRIWVHIWIPEKQVRRGVHILKQVRRGVHILKHLRHILYIFVLFEGVRTQFVTTPKWYWVRTLKAQTI